MNQKKKDRFRKGILVLCLLLCPALSGCTLARPELQQAKKEDQLIGVLVVVGEQEAERRHREEQEDRTFSSIKELEASLTSDVIVEGIRQADRSYAFEGVEGHMLGIVEEQGEDEDGPYPCVHFVSDGFFAEVKADTVTTDEGREERVSGAILASKALKEPVYMYPVYGRGDGSCYAILNGGGFLMGGVSTEGGVYTQTFSSKTSEEINGRKETNSTEIQVSLKMALPVEKIEVRTYNAKDELIENQEIQRETEEVKLPKEAAYVIVLEQTTDGQVKRSLYNWKGEQEETWEELYHQINYPGDDGLIEPTDLLLKKG